MWTQFREEGWRKTAIRILAKRLPFSNPGMEALADVIERDAQTDAESVPNGKLELEPDSVLLKPEPTDKSQQTFPELEQERNAEVFFQVGADVTTVSGRTFLIKDSLPKIGARWDGEAGVWTMPAARTHELITLCNEKQVRAVEHV
jgi:hypothetical protein